MKYVLKETAFLQKLLGAIQIIRDTFLPYFRPPPPFGDKGATPSLTPKVSRIIWMAP